MSAIKYLPRHSHGQLLANYQRLRRVVSLCMVQLIMDVSQTPVPPSYMVLTESHYSWFLNPDKQVYIFTSSIHSA